MKRAIVYQPGVISLAVLIPVFAFKLINFYTSNNQRILEVTWFVLGDTTHFYGEPPPPREYSAFDITGKEGEDHHTLDSVGVKVHNLLTFRDSITGVCVNFSDAASYESFVRVIGFSREMIQCLASENLVYIFYGKKTKLTVRQLECGTAQMLRALRREPPDSVWTAELWPVIVMFVLLCIISVCYIQQRAMLTRQ